MQAIKFYYEYEPYGWLSNYHSCEFLADNRIWPTTEHYYQAQKSTREAFREAVRVTSTPDQAKTMGNGPECDLRPDWNIYRIIAMRNAIQAKFTQNLELMELLLGTGSAELMENSAKDYYWGIGADGSGRNMLGLMLMNLREELRKGSR